MILINPILKYVEVILNSLDDKMMRILLMFEFVILLSSLCSVTASSCDQVPECLPDDCNLSITQTDVGQLNLDWSKTWWDLDLSCVQEMFISLNGKLN